MNGQEFVTPSGSTLVNKDGVTLNIPTSSQVRENNIRKMRNAHIDELYEWYLDNKDAVKALREKAGE